MIKFHERQIKIPTFHKASPTPTKKDKSRVLGMVLKMSRRNLSYTGQKGNPSRGGKTEEKAWKGREKLVQSKGFGNHFKGGNPDGYRAAGMWVQGTRHLRKPEGG